MNAKPSQPLLLALQSGTMWLYHERPLHKGSLHTFWLATLSSPRHVSKSTEIIRKPLLFTQLTALATQFAKLPRAIGWHWKHGATEYPSEGNGYWASHFGTGICSWHFAEDETKTGFHLICLLVYVDDFVVLSGLYSKLSLNNSVNP